eukprot:3360264-Amphidinium_carterae.1
MQRTPHVQSAQLDAGIHSNIITHPVILQLRTSVVSCNQLNIQASTRSDVWGERHHFHAPHCVSPQRTFLGVEHKRVASQEPCHTIVSDQLQLLLAKVSCALGFPHCRPHASTSNTRSC